MAVFLYSPTVFKLSYFTLIHAISRYFTEKRGQNVGTESPDHRQSEALARPLFHGTILLIVTEHEEITGVLSEGGGL